MPGSSEQHVHNAIATVSISKILSVIMRWVTHLRGPEHVAAVNILRLQFIKSMAAQNQANG